MLVCASVFLCACFGLPGGKEKEESALSVAYQKLVPIAKKTSKISVSYNENNDYMSLEISTGANIDKIFKEINSVVKKKELGFLKVGFSYYLLDSEKEKVDSYVGKLPCKSIKVLELSFDILETKPHKWTNILSKVETFRSDTLFDVNSYTGEAKANLLNVKKIWVDSGNFRGVESFPNVEELGLCATMPSVQSTSSGKSYNYGVKENSTRKFTYYDPKTGKRYEYVYKASGSKNKVTTRRNPTESSTKKRANTYHFSESITDIEDVMDLKDLKKLKKITIAPLYDMYDLDASGVKYLYTIYNARNDLLINKPETDIKKNDYISLAEVVDTNIDMIRYEKDSILNDFFDLEVKRIYKKAKKFKVKKKKAKIKKKALIFMSKPFTTDYKSKRAFCETGDFLTSKELGNKFKFPERAGDYELFVYVYPTYKKVGSYDKGTKAYSETYYVQVFDLQKKIASKPLKIATAQP